MLFAAIGDTPYKVVLLLHILSAIIGFGAVFLSALYGRAAERHKGAEGLAIAETNYDVSQVATYFIYAVFVFGILLVLMSDDVFKFSQGWLSASFALYLLGVGLSHGMLRPNVRRMHALMRELASGGPPVASAAGAGRPPQVDEIEHRARTVGIVGAVLNLNVVLLLYLMIWKPGF
jgi:uncharacterized membrane protein